MKEFNIHESNDEMLNRMLDLRARVVTMMYKAKEFNDEVEYNYLRSYYEDLVKVVDILFASKLPPLPELEEEPPMVKLSAFNKYQNGPSGE